MFGTVSEGIKAVQLALSIDMLEFVVFLGVFGLF
jgi:hypothetical protein